MNESDARKQLEDILANEAPGEKATVQSQGQADHPHGPDAHVDGWEGTKQADGSVTIAKSHAA